MELDAFARCAAFGASPSSPAALALLDFSTAFPHICRDFILWVMRLAGFPPQLLNLAKATWRDSHVIAGDGRFLYSVGRGVGQGCSAAASLFVLGIEPLLRVLERRLDPARYEALSVFADDVALTCHNVARLVALEPIFARFSQCATLVIGTPKCVIIPLASGCFAAAAARVRIGLDGTPWHQFSVASHAALIGIQIGPTAYEHAWSKPLCKLGLRVSQIAGAGRSVADGLWLARRLAWPVLGYTAQVYPAPPNAAFASQLAVQRVAHLPHHGVPPALLRSLPTVGDLELLPLDLYIVASRALASTRLAPLASAMLAHLRVAATESVLRPLNSVSSSGGLRSGFVFQPVGWDGGALASHVVEACGVLARARLSLSAAERRKGRAPSLAEVARAIEPCLGVAALGTLLGERVRLWLPPRFLPRELASSTAAFVGVLAKCSSPERWASLKFLCNAWTLAHRFGGSVPPCPACGCVLGERLQHIVACRAFWAPIFHASPEFASATFAELALSASSPKALHRAFAALASPSRAAWGVRVCAVA